MTAPTDNRPTDTIRDAFEAMLWFLACLIGPLRPRKITPAEEVGALAACEVETDFEPDEPPAPLLAFRDLIQRAAEEHNRRALDDWHAREQAKLGGEIEALRANLQSVLDSACRRAEELARERDSKAAEIERLTAERASLLAALGTGLVWVCSDCPAVSPAQPGYELGITEPCVCCGDGIAEVVKGTGAAAAELAARAPVDAPSLARARAVTRLLALGLDGQEVAHLLADAASIVAGRGRLTSPGALAILADYVAPADASLEAAEQVWRGEWQRMAGDIRSMSEAGKSPTDILAILLTHIDRMPPLAVVRAVDASCPPTIFVPTQEQAQRSPLLCALHARGETERTVIDHLFAEVERLRLRLIKLSEHSANPLKILRDDFSAPETLASRPGLTEEQARRDFEAAIRDAAAKGGPYCVTHAREAVATLDAALRASRGEAGPATEPTRAERVAEAQRLRAEARAEAEACTVPMPADLLARYPRSADPPEPDRPTGLTSAMHDAQQRPSEPPDPLALDPEDGTLCADCKTPRNGYHGALCSVRAGAKPGRVPDPRATLRAGDPASKLPKRGPSGVRVTGELDTPWGRLPILDLGEDKEPSR